MSVKSILHEAAQALKFNRQRSVLTCMSLAWGVACFVILYSYGDGFHIALQTAFRAIGQDLVLTFGGQTSTQAGGERAGRRSGSSFPMSRPSASRCRRWRRCRRNCWCAARRWCGGIAPRR